MSSAEISVLIISSSSEKSLRYEALLKSCDSKLKIVSASSGMEGRSKIENDIPSFVFVEYDLAKYTGTQLVEWVLAKSNLYKDMPCVLLGDVEPSEEFLNAISHGQLHLLPSKASDDDIMAAGRSVLFFIENLRGGRSDFQIKEIKKDEMLFKQGEKSQSVYLLKKGRLKAIMDGQGGAVVVLGFIEEGEFVGEMAYINGSPRTAHVMAVDDSQLIEIPPGTMDYFLASKPAWSKALLKTLSHRIEESNMRKLGSSE